MMRIMFFSASRQGDVDIVRLLLNNKANPDHADNEGWTPLRSAAWGGNTKVWFNHVSLEKIRIPMHYYLNVCYGP